MLIEIREEMAREADFDTDLYLEMVRTGRKTGGSRKYALTEPAEDPAVKRRHHIDAEIVGLTEPAEDPAVKRSKRKRPVD